MTAGGRGEQPLERDVAALNPLSQIGKYDFNYKELDLTRKEQSSAKRI
jgi:hypothetical protein